MESAGGRVRFPHRATRRRVAVGESDELEERDDTEADDARIGDPVSPRPLTAWFADLVGEPSQWITLGRAGW